MLQQHQPELVLELPPLHKPIARVVWWHVWDSTKHFLTKAGTIIFFLSILIWFLTSYTPSLQYTSNPSVTIGAVIAKFFAPALYPIGLSGDAAWIMAFAFLIGFVAKESVLSALTITTGKATPMEALRSLGMTPPQLAAVTIFMILYVPCMATIAVMYSETRSWKIVLASVGLMLSIAYLGMILTYLLGILL
jgi:ferrous iron transport protein B